MDHSVLIYNHILGMQSGLSSIEICSSSRFDPVSETLSNYRVWVFPTYVLEPNLHKTGVKITK